MCRTFLPTANALVGFCTLLEPWFKFKGHEDAHVITNTLRTSIPVEQMKQR